MCGIAAVSRSSPSSIDHLKSLGVALALAIEDRGPHATGFAWSDDTGHPWYWKQPGPAGKMAKHVPLPNHRQELLVHTRWATHGDPKVNENNHPVTVPGLTLIHNGVITNHRELHELLNAVPTTEVDSEALANLVALGPELLDAEVWEVLELVKGSAAIAWLDSEDPGVLHLARLAGRPMSIGWTLRGDLVMASTQGAMMRAGKAANIHIGSFKFVPEGTYMRVERGEVVFSKRLRIDESESAFKPRRSWAAKSTTISDGGGVRLQSSTTDDDKQLILPIGYDGLTQKLNRHRITDIVGRLDRLAGMGGTDD